jgi:hypothetical protein
MANATKPAATIVGIAGTSNEDLRVLANFYHEPFDPESVLSVVLQLAHKPEPRWSTLYSTETWCTAMDQSARGTLAVVSMAGALHVSGGERWEVVDLECPDGLNSVWSSSADQLFAVGEKGERVRVSGRRVEVVRDPERRRLNGVHGSSSRAVYAVGDEGLVWHFDGEQWVELPAPTANNLLAVHCVSEREVFVAGVEGTLQRWAGGRWDRVPGPGVTITSLATVGPTLYAAAGQDGVFALQGSRLEPLKKLPVYRLRAVGALLFGVGNRLVAQYDGAGWWGGDLEL